MKQVFILVGDPQTGKSTLGRLIQNVCTLYNLSTYYDQYDSFIIVDESKESVLKRFEIDKWGYSLYRGPINVPSVSPAQYFFEPNQGELHIEEVDLTAPALILGSFNAG